MNIDPSLIDVDFVAAADAGGHMRGCNPRQDRPGEFCSIFEEKFKGDIIPRSDWKSLIETHKPDFARDKSHQYNQRNESSCTGNACAGAYSYTWNRKYGKQHAVAPSPISTYKFCTRNDSGSTTSCIMKRARDVGQLLIDSPQNRTVLKTLGLNENHVIGATGWNQSFPSGWEDTAKNFRWLEYFEITNVDGFFTALFLGFDILYGRAGHAIHGVDPIWDSGKFLCKYDNSWGAWGDSGFGYDSLDYLVRHSAAYGAYAFRSIVDPYGSANLVAAPSLATAL